MDSHTAKKQIRNELNQDVNLVFVVIHATFFYLRQKIC